MADIEHKELTLSNFCLPWDCISRIGKLPNLKVLKLLSGAFDGQRWDMREEEFPELSIFNFAPSFVCNMLEILNDEN